MTNEAQIAERLAHLHGRLAARIGGQPKMSPYLVFDDRKVRAVIYTCTDDWDTEIIPGETFAEALAGADAFIDTMPTPEERALQDFMKAVATAIEKGRDAGVDLEFLNPLSDTMKRLSENALTHQEATQ